MNVSLTAELEGVVRDYVQRGMYGNQSEVVRAALRLLHERDQERAAKLEALKRDVSTALEGILRGDGEYVSAEEFKARGRKRLKNQE